MDVFDIPRDDSMIAHVANGQVVMKLSGTAICGGGFIRSCSVEAPPIEEVIDVTGSRHAYRTRHQPVITLEIEMEPDSELIHGAALEDFSEILTESLSSFQLMKQLNKRWKKEDESKSQDPTGLLK